MKRLVIGILAHVDSGKTTLSEGLLYASGTINRPGRVDHRNSFLDTNEIEMDRGITIFSKQAVMNLENTEFTLVDTPGHIDFSAEAERTLRVLDYAILVISGSDGVQSHTQTLWKLLYHYDIPTFVFVNKMDLPASDRQIVMEDLKKRLSECCIDFTEQNDSFFECAAMCDNEALDEYIENESLCDATVKNMIAARKLFPCFYGSALKNEGVREFLDGLDRYTNERKYGTDFGAKVFKISEDDKKQRLTYMKITGGSLKARDVLGQKENARKVNELRIYSGVKYKSVPEAFAGSICAVTGLTDTFPGEGFGFEQDSEQLISEPVFIYSVGLPSGIDVHTALAVFKKLETEETQLHVFFNERLQKIEVQVMGEVQLEVLKRILKDRFDMEIGFEHGTIIYKETIASPVEGVGHYEPLRHYAEVHLLMEPGERGSGLAFHSKCNDDVLAKNWQRLIMTHLAEKTHLGVLTGSPITDMKITLINGRAHIKHTDGGDFRQATYRAVRQGLMQAKSILLEPWYSFALEVPIENVGRAMTDLEQMGAQFTAPMAGGDLSSISGSAPVCAIRDYHSEVTAYTHGRGRLICSYKGYFPCSAQEQVVKEIGYECEADLENTADSVFCSHGSGVLVKWDKVFEHMHLAGYFSKPKLQSMPQARTSAGMIADEKELLMIFERTYGKIKHQTFRPMRTQKETTAFKSKPAAVLPVYLLIDGYNIIFASEELKKIAQESLDDARILLINRVCNYQIMHEINVILVFDAYKVKGSVGNIERVHGIDVVYTKEAETADAYIEKASHELHKKYRVRVATSDSLEQIIIFGHGAVRISAPEFLDELKSTEDEIRRLIEENNLS